MAGVGKATADRPGRSFGYRDVGATDAFQDGKGISGRRSYRHIARRGGQPQYVQLRTRQGHEQGDGVIDAGIGVDDDRFRTCGTQCIHGVNSVRGALNGSRRVRRARMNT